MPGRPFTFLQASVMMSLILFGCNSKKDVAEQVPVGLPLPANGTYCYKAKSGATPEYFHLQFNGDHINGSILMTEEVAGEVYYNFSGHVAADSLLKVEVHNSMYTTETGNWVIHFFKDRMELMYQLNGNTVKRNYDQIDCATMPDTAAYASVKEVEEESYAEYIENVPYESYESSVTALHEYLRVWKDGKRVFGKGAGDGDGKDGWTFDFNGLLVNDSTMQVKVKYQLGKGKTLSTQETWIEDKSLKKLRVKEEIPGRPGSSLYHQTGPEGIPDYYDKILWMTHE